MEAIKLAEFYLLGYGGVLLHLLTKIYEARKTHTSMDYVLEGIATAISVLIVTLFVYSKDDLATMYPLTMVTSVLLGYSAQSFLRVFIKMKDNEIKKV